MQHAQARRQGRTGRHRERRAPLPHKIGNDWQFDCVARKIPRVGFLMGHFRIRSMTE